MTELDKAMDNIYKTYYSQPPPDTYPILNIQGGDNAEANVIRIDATVCLRWVCTGDHDHRFRFMAWLCNLVRGVE